MNIFIKNNLFFNEELTNEGLIVALGLNKLSKQGFAYINYEILYLAITNDENMKLTRERKQKLTNGINNLKDLGIINKHIDISKPSIIDTENLYVEVENEKYIVITEYELSQIIKCNIKRFDYGNLLRYFMTTISTINNKTFAGFTSIDKLASMCNISPKTIKTSYNPILEEMKLLYIHRVDYNIVYENGTIKRVNNTYGRFEYKENIIDVSNKYIDTINNIKISMFNVLSASEKASIKQRYNSIKKKLDQGIYVDNKEILNLVPLLEKYNLANINTPKFEPIKITSLLCK